MRNRQRPQSKVCGEYHRGYVSPRWTWSPLDGLPALRVEREPGRAALPQVALAEQRARLILEHLKQAQSAAARAKLMQSQAKPMKARTVRIEAAERIESLLAEAEAALPERAGRQMQLPPRPLVPALEAQVLALKLPTLLPWPPELRLREPVALAARAEFVVLARAEPAEQRAQI